MNLVDLKFIPFFIELYWFFQIDKNDHPASESDETESSSDNGLREVLARGFPWTVKRVDVGDFFADVNIIGGVEGIDIRKDGAMEAVFFVDSDDQLQRALLHNKQLIGSRMIYGMYERFGCGTENEKQM